MPRKHHQTLKGLFSLSHNIKLYVPSTINVNKKITTTKQVNRISKIFSDMFGGATIVLAMILRGHEIL